MISSILAILGGLFQTAGAWMTARASPKNTEARVMTEENKILDKVHNDLKNEDLDAIRRDRPPS